MQDFRDIQTLTNKWNQLSVHTFSQLVNAVRTAHEGTQETAVRAVNRMITVRNWLIGYCVVEYEQGGEDRAKYGEQMLEKLAQEVNVKGINVTTLEQSRRFYLYYPQLLTNLETKKTATTLQKSENINNPATALQKFVTPAEYIINYLSFSHIREIMTQSDPLARFFYESECIRSGWSVRDRTNQLLKLF